MVEEDDDEDDFVPLSHARGRKKASGAAAPKYKEEEEDEDDDEEDNVPLAVSRAKKAGNAGVSKAKKDEDDSGDDDDDYHVPLSRSNKVRSGPFLMDRDISAAPLIVLMFCDNCSLLRDIVRNLGFLCPNY